MSALDYDRTTLDANDLSFDRQLTSLEEDGWELEQHDGGGSLRYLRRHRRIDGIKAFFDERRQRLSFVREDDGTWSAVLRPLMNLGSSADDRSAGGATPVEAAEAAQELFASPDDQP